MTDHQDRGAPVAAAAELDAGQARELLALVLEALDIPSPYTAGDAEVHDKILKDRVLQAKIMLRGVVGEKGRQDPDSVAWSVGYLRRQLAEHPAAGYKTFQQGVAERHAAEAAKDAEAEDLAGVDQEPGR